MQKQIFNMKKLTLLPIILLLFSCDAEKYSDAEIKQEIIDVTNEYNQAWETVDMDIVSKFHDKDIKYYWHGFLASSSNEEFLKVFKEWLSPTKVWKMEVENFDVQVLAEDLAIIGFNSSSSTTILTNGESYDYGTGAFTYVWKKSNGKWKIIHIHESALEREE